MQAIPRGVGANGARRAASFVHAAAALGSVPPAGPHRSVHVLAAAPSPGCTTIVNDVAGVAASVNAASVTPTTCMRGSYRG